MNMAVLTPYYYPFSNLRRFQRNIGDGLILKAIQRRSGPFSRDAIFSSRRAPTGGERRVIDEGQGLILAGANQLQDDFQPWPGLSPAEHRRSKLRVIPYGVGIGGKEDNSGASFTDEAIEHIDILHDRIEYSSWRCPRTVAALKAVLPQRAEQFLMTGCPVALDNPLLEGSSFHEGDEVVAVTITDRRGFLPRELPMIDRIAKRYPRARKLLIIHTDFLFWLGPLWQQRLPLGGLAGERLSVRHHAMKLGYEIVVPKTAEEVYQLYKDTVDIHFGSRLHAHLLMLSLNKKSHLTFVDERMTGLAEAFDFPLCPPTDIDANIDFDFEIVRKAARRVHGTMLQFERSLKGSASTAG